MTGSEGMSSPPAPLQSRQWSCSTLLRGNSFLREQRATNNMKNFDDVLAVPQLFINDFLQHRKES